MENTDGKSPTAMPDSLISQATLQYIGYNEEIAAQYWKEWSDWPPGDILREPDDSIRGMPFIDFATGHIKRGQMDVVDEDDQEWYHRMDSCGIAKELQDAIMDPVFKRIRLTESCFLWIADTMRMRYRGSTSPSMERVTALSPAAESASHAPGYTIVFKTVDEARISGLHDSDGKVINLQSLISSAPSDFHRSESAFYFTIDREIAVYYANYAKRWNKVDSVVIVQMAIPNSAIESLSETERLRVYWPSAEWKNLVFHCRTNTRLPSDFASSDRLRLPNKVYRKLDSAEQITEHMVLRTRGGRQAIQYVWPVEGGEEFLEEHGIQNLKFFPLTAREHEEWYKNELLGRS
ncbi:uncharacterized protein F5Z01DRAFT_752748 [Emericellopsis atlantica]|uniref:Uncharacterized protein n=1 Tax=Emericellopsis atlantica TaxID=2614577 RepID=A0A9P7ZGC6_9HYPO|nr:uncharacterized protein F5Z01DRAFT_752748 [Emericellopsis atlantica]KAG9251633.1 hypothetical protein F5Z01DRAFT_752748 [Emericellopsis atlantica]